MAAAEAAMAVGAAAVAAGGVAAVSADPPVFPVALQIPIPSNSHPFKFLQAPW